MILLPLLLLQVGSVPRPTANPLDQRYGACMILATSKPMDGAAEAERFRVAGGGARARQCLGMAYSAQGRWREAAATFELAAREADVAKDPLAPRYWAQSGNAWLAAGDAEKARAALSTALIAGTLVGADRGEALLDRARALVIAGQNEAARIDLDAALSDVPKDPLGWLLSSTLARRMGDLPRAKTDIAEALKLAADDGAVQLEAGNIAALSGDAAGARAAWQSAAKLAPGTPIAENARAALVQFEDGGPTPGPVPAPPAPTPAPAPSK